ncbi:MAG: oligosaccharide flippase family protein, partial [Clostridiales bacterium]|nr:oligosaccharide flippase family protein [Clostridiales bacterium]
MSYSQTAVGILISLLYTPVMLRILGQNEYGLYNTVSSTIGMLSVLDFGFSSAYIRYYTLYKLKNEEDKINKLNGLFFTVYFVIGIIAFLCGIFLMFNLDMIFGTGLTSAEQEKARIMLLISSISLFLSFASTGISAYITAHERYIFTKTTGIIKTVLNPLLQLPLILMGYGAVGLTALSLAFNVIFTAVNRYYAFGRLKMRASFGHWEKGLFKSIFAFSGLVAFNLIVDQVNGGLDNVIIARYCGTADVAVYAVGASLASHYQSFSTQISSVFVPRVHRIVNTTADDENNQRKVLTEFFTKVGRIQFLVLALIASGVVFFGKDFIYLWAGEGYDDAYLVAVMRIITGTIPLIENVGIEIQRAENRHYYGSIILFIGALFNLGLTIYLCQVWGAVGAAVGTAITAVTANGIIMNIVYHKKMNINVIVFWKNIFKQLLGMIVPFIVGTLIMLYAKTDTIITLLIWIIVYALVYA